MPKCAGCSGGGGPTGPSGPAGPTGATGPSGGGATDFFGAMVSAIDIALGESPISQTFGNTRILAFGKAGGSLTVNIEPITLDAGDFFDFFYSGSTNAIYSVEVEIYVSSTDCTQKLITRNDESPGDNDNSFEFFNFSPTGDWITAEAGGDLSFNVVSGIGRVSTAAGGCFSGQITLNWSA
jgi:hypothetical protein